MPIERATEPQNHKPTEVSTGGTCAACGFTYLAYYGHLEPCPRCAVQRAAVMLKLVLLRVPKAAFAGAEAMAETLAAAYPVRR